MKFKADRPTLWGAATSTASCMLALAVLVGCGILGGGTGDDDSTRDDSGVIVEGGDVGVNALQLGDCFDNASDDDSVDIVTVEAIPCEQPHDNEVYYLGALPEAEFPGEDLVAELVSDQCLTVFDAFAGVAYSESMLDIRYIFPSEGSWSQGDRGYICVVYDVEFNKLEGSMRGRGY